MKCKQCDNELTGKQQAFCSKKCNMAHRRNGNTTVTDSVTVTAPTVTEVDCVTAKQGDVVTDDIHTNLMILQAGNTGVK